MIYTAEQVKRMTVEELEQAISKLTDLRSKMMGPLYRRVLTEEIENLQDFRDELIYVRNSFDAHATEAGSR